MNLNFFFPVLWVMAGFALTSGPAGATPSYQGSGTCKSCHQDSYSAWQESHHAKAWTQPSEATVDGDFGGAEFVHNGRKTRFYKKAGRYFIETEDTTGGPKEFEVKGVGGIAPLQQYLIETEPGRLQSLDIAWDQEKEVWYHLYPDQALPPGDGFHWGGPYKNWNSRCAECHATGFERNYSPRTRRYESTQAEYGVGCEACHGPAEAHLNWARDPANYRPDLFPGTDATGLVLGYRKTGAQTEIQQCAGCHSRREPFEDGNPLPGVPFHDSYRLALLRDGLYHADGQILDEVYVYGSFLQSRMYAKGVRCSDCHDPHSADLNASGNAICTQCHSEGGNSEFPSLARKTYDDPSHHFHEPGTEAAACVSCHMVERIYMGIDGRRDHSFRVPRPDLSVRFGTPNACTTCHSDQTATWAAGVLAERYPTSEYRGPHFAETFSQARQGDGGLDGPLLEIAVHEDFPGIVRASALDLLRTGMRPRGLTTVLPLLADPDPLVRTAALALMAQVPATERLTVIEPALSDPVRSVRIAAARAALGAAASGASNDLKQALLRANRDWQNSLTNKLDFPETHMVIGGTALALRNPRAAIKAFQEVTILDPQLAEAWVMQVRLHLAAGDFASAEFTLQKALQNVPGHPVLLELKQQLTAR